MNFDQIRLQVEAKQFALEAGFPFNKYGLLQGDEDGEIDADEMFERFAKAVVDATIKRLAAGVSVEPVNNARAAEALDRAANSLTKLITMAPTSTEAIAIALAQGTIRSLTP